jgi:hypothetical protein
MVVWVRTKSAPSYEKIVAASLVSADATPLASTVTGNNRLRIRNILLMLFITASFGQAGCIPE